MLLLSINPPFYTPSCVDYETLLFIAISLTISDLFSYSHYEIVCEWKSIRVLRPIRNMCEQCRLCAGYGFVIDDSLHFAQSLSSDWRQTVRNKETDDCQAYVVTMCCVCDGDGLSTRLYRLSTRNLECGL